MTEIVGRVLVIDDEISLRDVITEWLESCQYEVYSAADAEVARQLIEEKHPDLVLADIVMPGPKIFDMLAEAREAHPRMKIVIMSGLLDHTSFADDMSRVGAAIIMRKPFSLNELTKNLNAALGVPSVYA